MSANPDLDAIVSAWLDEGPTDLPDATRRAILTSVPITRRAGRGPFARWTWPSTKGLARLATAALVAAFAIGGAIYVVRLPTMGGPNASPTLAPTSPPATATILTLREGRLPAGSYSTTAFQPTLRFNLGAGWTARFPDDLDEIAFDRPNQDFVAITRVSQVVDPTTGTVGPVPDNLMGWLAADPDFEWAGPPEPVEIAGFAGTMIEGQVKAGLPSTDIFAYSTGNMRVVGPDRMRYYVLPLDGPDLTIVVEGRTDSGFAADLAALKVLLDSLEIGPS
jgi:hypothetical protein